MWGIKKGKDLRKRRKDHSVRLVRLNLELMLQLYILIGCDFLETCLCQTKHLEIITGATE
jgi:hypothetical protein